MTADAFAQPGDWIKERYRVERLHAEGGMGLLYLATDRDTGRTVIVKFPKQEYLAKLGFRARFERESDALIRVSTPHVVAVYDRGEYRGAPFMVLQYLPGGSLEDLISKQGRLAPAEVAEWLPAVCRALDALHRRGIIHRDIKAGNILFDEDGQAYVADFGIAKTLVELDRENLQAAASSTGGALGSVETLAPEYIHAEYTPAYDQYGLATAVYRALSGQLPFDGRTTDEIRYNIVGRPPRPLVELAPHASAALCEAVHRGLSKGPAERFPNCLAFAQAFAQALSAPGAAAAPPVYELAIQADVEGATVSLDGVAAGTAPLNLRLPAGRHQVRVKKAGYQAFEQTIELQADQLLQARLSRIGRGAGKPQPEAPTDRSSPPRWRRWALAGICAAALAVAAAVGGVQWQKAERNRAEARVAADAKAAAEIEAEKRQQAEELASALAKAAAEAEVQRNAETEQRKAREKEKAERDAAEKLREEADAVRDKMEALGFWFARHPSLQGASIDPIVEVRKGEIFAEFRIRSILSGSQAEKTFSGCRRLSIPDFLSSINGKAFGERVSLWTIDTSMDPMSTKLVFFTGNCHPGEQVVLILDPKAK